MNLMQKEINEWLIDLETVYRLGTPGNCALNVKGDKFIELIGFKACSNCSDLDLYVGDRATNFKTPEEALRALKNSFYMYSEGRKGRLYWRITPEVNMDDHRDLDSLSETYGQHLAPTDYTGYMRLFIQEKFE